MENNYDLSSLEGEFEVDSFVLSNGDPTGYGFHADFVSLLPALSQVKTDKDSVQRLARRCSA